MKRLAVGVLSVIVLVSLVACGGYSTPTAAPSAAPTSAPAGGGSPTSAPVSGQPVAVTISNFAFSPESVTVNVGGTVVWTNKDSATHTVVADDGTWKSGDLSQGGTFSFTFSTAGTFTYKCGIHPSMKGTVVVK